MPNTFKKNKTFINDKNRKKILKEYFNWDNSTNLAKKYWYTVHAVNKYLDGCATKTFIDEKGIVWRKCSICEPVTYKKLDQYKKHSIYKWKTILNSHCNSCFNRVVKNRRILEKNIKWKESKYLSWTRDSWNKNKWRYNLRRKIMRIIKYTDRHGKVIQKKDQN